MAGKKTRKSKRKHSFILTVCFISLAILFIVSLIAIKNEYDSRKEDVSQLQSQYDEKNAENKELQDEIDSGDEEEYKEKIARENGYIKPGDRVYQNDAAGE